MEKTTKKKKSKRLKKRFGFLVVGGLSLVLTICLSVGATLAWFAGSTWSSQSLYMGGPVYVEMAGRGTAGATSGTGAGGTEGAQTANWVGGAGNLDIKATAARKTGTVTGTGKATDDDMQKVLLPGQKYEIYSQARVFSTAYTTTDGTNSSTSNSSGANVTNTEKSGTAHITSKGRTTTTTTSVLRARFSIGIEFDPYVGFNNFKDTSYAANYPVQSDKYYGDYVGASGVIYSKGTTKDAAGNAIAPADVNTKTNTEGLAWDAALGKATFNNLVGGPTVATENARRDAVPNADTAFTATTDGTIKTAAAPWNKDVAESSRIADLMAIKQGQVKSIYAWKFVSKDFYLGLKDDGAGDVDTNAVGTVNGKKYQRMNTPFDGTDVNAGGTGYYGVWILDDAGNKTESDAFYKARCNNYLQTYVEEYITEYDAMTNRTIGETLKAFETELNDSFIDLINDSSDAIHDGYVNGMTVNKGIMTYSNGAVTDANYATYGGGTYANVAAAVKGAYGINASWLYVDPTIGNDTNTNEIATGAGGWWYLVATDGASAATNGETVSTITDVVTKVDGTAATDNNGQDRKNTPTPGAGFKRAASNNRNAADFYAKTGYGAADPAILDAKLYEINPLTALAEAFGTNASTDDVVKVVSYSFPFVNGTNVLPSKELTNIFANAKLTFQISFQAIQAFFPYTTSIDGLNYKDALLGTEKALNIKNAIPIFNEAFEY